MSEIPGSTRFNFDDAGNLVGIHDEPPAEDFETGLRQRIDAFDPPKPDLQLPNLMSPESGRFSKINKCYNFFPK